MIGRVLAFKKRGIHVNISLSPLGWQATHLTQLRATVFTFFPLTISRPKRSQFSSLKICPLPFLSCIRFVDQHILRLWNCEMFGRVLTPFRFFTRAFQHSTPLHRRTLYKHTLADPFAFSGNTNLSIDWSCALNNKQIFIRSFGLTPDRPFHNFSTSKSLDHSFWADKIRRSPDFAAQQLRKVQSGSLVTAGALWD